MSKKYIYESPDNGKTIFRRRFGDYYKKELVRKEKNERCPVCGNIKPKNR